MTSRVIVVDDEIDVRESIALLLRSVGIESQTCDSVDHFESEFDEDEFGCVITDVRMPLRSGIDLLDLMEQRAWSTPVLVISGHADVPMAVRAVKKGAVDFVEKPFPDQVLIDAVNAALTGSVERLAQSRMNREMRERFGQLTSREEQVLDELVAGNTSAAIAARLELSPRTVEMHRSRIMKKLEVRSLAELIAWAVRVKPAPGDSTT